MEVKLNRHINLYGPDADETLVLGLLEELRGAFAKLGPLDSPTRARVDLSLTELHDVAFARYGRRMASTIDDATDDAIQQERENAKAKRDAKPILDLGAREQEFDIDLVLAAASGRAICMDMQPVFDLMTFYFNDGPVTYNDFTIRSYQFRVELSEKHAWFADVCTGLDKMETTPGIATFIQAVRSEHGMSMTIKARKHAATV